ncbi:hypothetical protein E3Q11_02507 [Wallemia mellicola]|nr:hypothetical protein E3Q14_02354 [Wallemia mellicola]TIC27354.1 hypothetical protein E3Q11_02507 [Wallemia mellicola]
MKIELQSWVEALEKYDASDYIHALRQFSTMQSRGQSSKIEFNRAVIHASLGDQKGATELFNSALRIDPYFAIAHYQSGVCNFMRGRYEHARSDYEASQKQLRGNSFIDYAQLGLAYKLENTNIDFNIALTYYYSGRPEDGVNQLQIARNGASTDQNSVIDDCMRDEAKGYMPYSVQPGIVFRPSESQIKNLEKKDFIGQAKVLYTDDDGTSPDIPLNQNTSEQSEDVPLSRRLPGGGGTLKRNPTHWQPKLLRRPTAGSRKQSSNETTPVSSGTSTPVTEKGGFFSGLSRQKTERRKAPTEEMRTKTGLTPDEAALGPKNAAMLSRARTLGSSTLAEKRSKSEQDVPTQATFQPLADPARGKGVTLTDVQLPSERMGELKDVSTTQPSPTPPTTDDSRSPSPSLAHTSQPPPQLHHSSSQPQLAPSRARFPTRKTSLKHVHNKFKRNEPQPDVPPLERRRSRSFNEGDDYSLAYTEHAPAEAPNRSNTLFSKISGRSNSTTQSSGINHDNRKGKPSAIDTLSNVPAGWPRSDNSSPQSLFSQTQSHRPPQLPALQIGDDLMHSEQTPKAVDNNVALTITPSTPSVLPDKDFSIKFDERTDTMYDTQNGTSVPSSVSDNSFGNLSNKSTDDSGGSPVDALTALNGGNAANGGPFKPTAPLKIQEKPTLTRQASALRRRGTYGMMQEQQKQGAIDISNSMKKMGIEEGNEENDDGVGSTMIKGMSPVEASSLNAERMLEKGTTGMSPVNASSLNAERMLERKQPEVVRTAPTPPPAQTPPTPAAAPPRSPESKSLNKSENAPSLKVRFKIHYGEDVRGMLVGNETSFEAFIHHILRKFEKRPGSFRVRFKDEDGIKITIQDHSDLELAIDTARLHGNGRSDGKLDICEILANFEDIPLVPSSSLDGGDYRHILINDDDEFETLEAYDREDVAQAVNSFKTIAHTSKIQFNIAMIYDGLAMDKEALKCFLRSSELDPYLAIAHFQAGVSSFFRNLHRMLARDYAQIGLDYSLHISEVQFNLGVCLISAGRTQLGFNRLRLALDKSEKPEHVIIESVLNNSGRSASLFAVPVGMLFQPPEVKIKNLGVKTDFAGFKLLDNNQKRPKTAQDGSNRPSVLLGRSNTTPPIKSDAATIPILRSRTSSRANLTTSAYPKSAVINEDIISEDKSDVDDKDFEINNNFQNQKQTSTKTEMYFTRRQFDQSSAELENNMLNGKVNDYDLSSALHTKRPPPILTLPLHKSNSPLPTPSTSASSEDSEKSFRQAIDEKLNSGKKQLRPAFINRSFSTLRTKSNNLISSKRSSSSIPKQWPSTSEHGTPMAVSPVGPISAPLPGSFVSTGPGTMKRTHSDTDGQLTPPTQELKCSVPNFNIRIKIFLNKDVRGMIISAKETPYEKFRDSVHSKFPHIEPPRLAIKFKDDDDLVTILDDTDWEMAIECAHLTMTKVSKGEEINPKTTQYSFFGPLGTGAITLLTPAITYLLYFACPNSYDDDTCQLLQKPAFERLLECDFWKSLFDLEAFGVYLAWYTFTVVAWAIIPAQWVRGTQLRDAFATLLMATGIAIGQIVRAGPEGFTYLADKWIPILTASLIMSVAQSVFCYAMSFTSGKLLALGGNTGSFVHDVGELNPSIGSFDIKTFNELRPGLALWWLLDISLACRQYATFGRLTDSMILVVGFHGWYVFDALYNEPIILTQMDIVHDGFGFMLAFGDLTWVPFVYSLQARFLAYHPNVLGPLGVFAVVLLQLLGYYIFRVSNAEKNDFRNGKNPKNLQYMQTKRGTKLLTSGWWGTLRHPNYLGDLIMAVAWSLPTGGFTPLTYFYPAYFTVLLIHRALRDDSHCREKYGDDWNAYIEKVPYCIFPYITSLLVKKLVPQAQLPARGSAFSAGYDLFSVEKKTIAAGDKALIDLGISISVPAGTYGRVAPRSGLAAKHHIHTGAGVIDADYRGRVFVLLFNLSKNDFESDRVAQLILEKIESFPVEEVEELDETVRGAGGFGSTGGFGKVETVEKVTEKVEN